MGVDDTYYYTGILGRLNGPTVFDPEIIFSTLVLESYIKNVTSRFESYRGLIENYTIIYPNASLYKNPEKRLPVYSEVKITL
jgi:hypothetical protein